jgi:hypothetical protein
MPSTLLLIACAVIGLLWLGIGLMIGPMLGRMLARMGESFKDLWQSL